MNENVTARDWTAERGGKWRAQLAGMEAMLAPVDDPLICALRVDAPYRIADVGCGGGGTAMEILRRAPAGSVIHGYDLSAELIEVAESRNKSEDRAITFQVADMAAAAPEVAYDRLVSRFGIMFFGDPPAAFANLAGWLRPGGRFAFAVWGRPAENPWMARVRQVVAEIIDLPATDPEGPGPFRYGVAEKLMSQLDRAGFCDLAVNEWRGGLPIGGGLGAGEAATFALAAFSTFGEQLAEAGGEALNEARRLLTARLSRYEESGVVRMDGCVHIVTGGREGSG